MNRLTEAACHTRNDRVCGGETSPSKRGTVTSPARVSRRRPSATGTAVVTLNANTSAQPTRSQPDGGWGFDTSGITGPIRSHAPAPEPTARYRRAQRSAGARPVAPAQSTIGSVSIDLLVFG